MDISGIEASVVGRALPFLMKGLGLSLLLTLVAMSGGIVLGFALALMRLSGRPVVAAVAATYVNGFRAVPLILVLFWFYFLVPVVLGHPIDALPSALIAFTAFEAAYYAEIVRAGLSSVPRSQRQAAAASGLSGLQTLRLVVLPQAIRIMAPLVVTQAVILFQDTSLVYVISLRDFMTTASIVANQANRLVEVYAFAALVYLCLCTAGSLTAKTLQRRRAYS